MNEPRSESQECLTQALRQFSDGDSIASEALLVQLYDELRRMAAGQMSRERPGHTLQPTALVHELWAKIFSLEERPAWPSRRHFFAWMAKAMGNFLKDYARHKKSQKSGGDRLRITLEGCASGASEDVGFELIDTVDAVDELAKIDELRATIVRMRAFAGLSYSEIAANLEISEKQVDRSLRSARLWLMERLNADQP